MHFHNWRLLLIFMLEGSAFTAEQLIKPEFENRLSVCMSLVPHLCPAMWQGKSTSMANWMRYAGTLFCALTFLSGISCGGACREELLWACVFLCAWQRTSCISPEQHTAHALTSAVTLTNLNLTWPGSPTSLLQSGADWRNKMHKVRPDHSKRMKTFHAHTAAFMHAS